MKEYKTVNSGSSANIRYAVMSMALMTVCYTAIKDHIAAYEVSADRISMLLVMYNVISVGVGVIVSAIADKFNDKHTGVRLSVLLTIAGYWLPVRFGIDLKVTLMGIGSAIFYAFAFSSLYLRSKGKGHGIGLLVGGSMAGIALGSFSGFMGHLMAPILMIFASPKDVCDGEAKNAERPKQKISAFLYLIFLMLAYTLLFYLFSSFKFDWNTFFKTNVKMLLVMAAGRAAGGILCNFIDRSTVVLASVSVGGALLYFSPDSKGKAFIGLFILSMSLAPLLLSAADKLPSAPALSFGLMSVAAYFGQAMSFTVKYKPSSILLCCSAVLIIAIWSDDFGLISTAKRIGRKIENKIGNKK